MQIDITVEYDTSSRITNENIYHLEKLYEF